MPWVHYIDPATYIPHAIRRKPIRAVYTADTLRNIAVHLFSVFEPFYLYMIFKTHGFAHPEALVFLYYGALYVPFSYLSVFAVRFLPRFGFRILALISVPFLLGYYLALFRAQANPAFLFLAVALLLIRFSLFWPAYHVYFARTSEPRRRATEIGNLAVLAAVASAVSPAVGGIILETLGFPILFGIVFGLVFLSAIPYAVADIREGHRGSLKPILHKLEEPGGRRAALAFFGQGIEESAATVAWPLFLALLAFSFRELGFLTMAATAVGLITTLFISRLVDHRGRKPLLLMGAPLTAMMWASRVVVFSPVTAFIANLLVGMTRPLVMIPFTAGFYDHIAMASRDEQMHAVLFREFALNFVGRGVFFFGGAALLWFNGSLRLLLAAAVPATFLMIFIIRRATPPGFHGQTAPLASITAASR